MPITDLATNVILDNVGKVYFLKTGVYRDQVGLDNNHPLSSVSALLIHIEDGVPQNVMVANYAPSKMASWASHDFPLWYRGQVEYTITGESSPRTFAQYFTYVPSILVAMNKNGTSIMDVNVTITQNTGANLLGGFADLTALNAEFPPTEELSDDLATAYVYDSGTKGFYRVAWNSGTSAWVWQLVDQALVTYGVQTKQYNVLPIKVQRGYAPSQTPLTVSDEVIRLIYQEIAYVNAVIANHTELIQDLDDELVAHMADLDNPHEVTALQTAYSNIVSLLTATTVQGAIDEIVGRLDTAEEDIVALEGRMDTAEEDIDDLETFRDTTVPATYETKTDASTHKNRTSALENANMIKSISRTGTNLITITYFDDTTSTVITLSELKSFIGNATQSLAGLMSAQDKADLDGLMALFESDGDSVVNTIAEVLAIFEDYPEGVDLVTALAGKVDKTTTIAGVDLQNNITKEELKTALDVDDLENTKVDKVAGKSLVEDTEIAKLEDLETQAQTDAKFNLKLDKDISTLELYNIVDTDLFFKRSASGVLQRVTAQQAKDYFVSAGLTFDATVNYMTNGLGAFKSAVTMIHPVTLQTNGDFRCSIRAIETNTFIYVLFPTITATNTLRVSTNNGTTYYNVLKNGSTMRASIVSGQLVRLQFDGTQFIADIQSDVEVAETYTTKLNSTFGKFAPLDKGVPIVKEIQGRTIPALSNLVTNGQFNDTSFWTFYNATVNLGKVRIYNEIGNDSFISKSNILTVGSVYYIKLTQTITTGNARLDGFGSSIQLVSGTQSYGRVAVSTTLAISRSLATQVNDVLIDDIMLFNLTASHGVTATSGTAYDNAVADIEAMLALNGGYISTTETTHLEDSEFKSVGKNLFDGELEYGKFNLTTGALESSAVDIRNKNAIKVIPSQTYMMSTTPTANVAFARYDVNMNFISNSIISGANRTITTTSTTVYIRFFASTSTFTSLLLQPVMFEQGTIATTYAPYNSETQKFNHGRLSKLPNGVSDKIRYDNGAYVLDRYVQELTLTSGMITNIDNATNAQWVRFTKPLDFVLYNNSITSLQNAQTIIVDGFIAGGAYSLGLPGTHTNYYPLQYSVAVPLGTYANLAAAQAALAGTKIWYQLATPLLATEVIDVDGTLIQESTTTVEQLQNIPASVTIEYAMDVEQTTKTLVERDKLQQLEIDNLEGRATALEARKTVSHNVIYMSATAWSTYTRVDGEVYGVYAEDTGVITMYYGTVGA